MFCGECGTKNKKGDLFCSNCGAKLVENVKVEKITKSKNNKEQNNVENNPSITKKKINKPLIIIVVAVLLVLGITYKIVSDSTSPKSVAKDYINALINKNTNKLYNYLELSGDKTFVTKGQFKKIVENSSLDIDNYSITDVTYGESKLTAKVKFSYTTKSGSSEKNDSLNLTKQKGNKYLIFDNWKISNDFAESIILKDYTLKVPVKSKLIFDDIEVNEKYLNKEKSNDERDVYVLPQVFMTKTNVKVVLDNGLEVEQEITPSNYYSIYTINFDENSLSKDAKEKMTDDSKKLINSIYQAAISGKEYKDIKDSYTKADKDLESNYDSFVSDLKNASSKLTKIDIKSASIYDLSLLDDGNMEVELKVNYDYVVEYTNYKKETTTSEKSNYGYMTIVIAKDKDSYELVNIKELKTYFYR